MNSNLRVNPPTGGFHGKGPRRRMGITGFIEILQWNFSVDFYFTQLNLTHHNSFPVNDTSIWPFSNIWPNPQNSFINDGSDFGIGTCQLSRALSPNSWSSHPAAATNGQRRPHQGHGRCNRRTPSHMASEKCYQNLQEFYFDDVLRQGFWSFPLC